MPSCVMSFCELIQSLDQVSSFRKYWLCLTGPLMDEILRSRLMCCVIDAQFVNLGQPGFEAKYVCTDPADWREHNPAIAQHCETAVPGDCVRTLDENGLDTVVPPSWRT
ncbi:MAG: hypothetical protein OEZ68_02675 [Gammaproteobacteria bacterium]|nr:hypothetical protein [Gammaproteobacteria bacterium]MDH5799685.1 hypothetical protein [Gammaproteobacteria bacterium]